MRFLKEYIFVCAVSLLLASCGDNVVDNYLPGSATGDIGVNIINSDYALNTRHKTYFNPFFNDGGVPMFNHYYGLTISLKLDAPSKLDKINSLTMFTVDYERGTDTIAFEFDKYRLHEIYEEGLGGFIITIDSLYIKGQEGAYYPCSEYTWNITLHDLEGHSSNPFVMATKAESYIYAEYFTSDLMEGNAIRINFDDPLPLTSSRKVKILLFDSQKKYLKDYPFEDINSAAPSITLNDIPSGAAYYRAEIDEVYYGVKRTYTGKFESLPERL